MLLEFLPMSLRKLFNQKYDPCILQLTKRDLVIEKICKVLFDCTPCMGSLYGTISFFIVGWPGQVLIDFPVWVFSLSGFNYLLNKILNK